MSTHNLGEQGDSNEHNIGEVILMSTHNIGFHEK